MLPRNDQARSPMIASAITDASNSGHIGHPAASINANTRISDSAWLERRNCIWAMGFQQAHKSGILNCPTHSQRAFKGLHCRDEKCLRAGANWRGNSFGADAHLLSTNAVDKYVKSL